MLTTFRRRLLAAILLVQVVALVALVWTSSQISEQASTAQTERLLESTVSVSSERINAYLEPAQSLVELTATLAADPSTENFDIAPMFEESLRRSPQLAGAFIASNDGDFTFVTRTDVGFRHKQIVVDDALRTTTVQVINFDGQLVEDRLEPEDRYNPTTRPWFVDASASPGELIWSDPYVFFTSGEIGVTTARTIVRDGEVVGVVGADIELASLSSFLRTLSPSPSAETVVTAQNGALLAHPDSSVLTILDGGTPRPVTIKELRDDYTSTALAALSSRGSRSSVVPFDSAEHGRSHATDSTLAVGDDMWTISIFAPVDELASELALARDRERNLTIVIGMLTIATLLLVLYPAIREVRRLEARANTDVLTKLPNRRSILNYFDDTVRDNTSLGVLMIDVDNFKNVNDTYGHQTGDDVLRAVSDRLQEHLPPNCLVGRLGGEEFLAVLPGHHHLAARRVAERLRQAIDAEPIETGMGPIRISISLGAVAGRSEGDGQDLMAAADLALLHAKDGGRNTVVMMDGGSVSPISERDVA